MTWGWMWIGILVLAVIVEALTDQLVSIWFVPGALLAVIFDLVNIPILWQTLAFALVAAAGVIFGRKPLMKASSFNKTKTNIEAIVGSKCVVTEKIDNYAGCGQARINGQIWSARGVGENDVFEVGEVLYIVAIEGVKLICKRQ